jgi:hypothetical protein
VTPELETELQQSTAVLLVVALELYECKHLLYRNLNFRHAIRVIRSHKETAYSKKIEEGKIIRFISFENHPITPRPMQPMGIKMCNKHLNELNENVLNFYEVDKFTYFN